MIVEVGEHKLKIDKSPVNELEVNITKVQFEFPSSMDGLVKKAFFTQEDVSKEVLLLTNECDIPSEVLFKQGQVRLGVIAYETDGDVLKERFNPTPCYFQVDEGSLIDADNTEPITPTDKEQIEQALTNLENNKQDLLVSGENIKTINNESLLGSGNLEVITDLSDYYTKEQTDTLLDGKVDNEDLDNYYKKTETYSKSEVDTIKTTIESEIPTKLSQLDNDSGFIDKSVNNLENYSKTSDMNNAISNAVGIETTNRQNSDIALQSQLDAITSASDVVDVVSTYQDLLDYDTSKLTEKDVIKVMQDSTHSNAISYYRWLSNAWSYVGSEGPFYTKGETDTLLNAKVGFTDYATENTGGVIKANTNCFLVNNSGIPSAKDYTYSQYSGLSNNAFIGKATLENVITGKGLVSNTDYANNTTGGVIKTASGLIVNSNGFPYANEYNYTSYKQLNNNYFIGKGTLENVISNKLYTQTQIDNSQNAQDTQIEELKQENELLLDQIPKGTATGQDITLNDSSNLPIKSIEISGNTSQDTLSGKNLFNKYGSLNEGGGRPNTISLNSQGQIVSTANYSEWRGRGQLIENLTANTDYTVSATVISATGNGNNNAIITISSATSTTVIYDAGVSKSVTKPYNFNFTFNTGENTSIMLSFSGNDTDVSVRPTTIFDNIQLEKGSATDYEPYCGGIPAPNPIYPIDVNVVKGDNVITECEKNLAYTGWAEEYKARINDTNKALIQTVDGRSCLWYSASAGYGDYDNKYMFKTNWKENTRYTFSFDIKVSGVNSINLQLVYTDGTSQIVTGSAEANTWTNISVTSNAGNTIKYLCAYWSTGGCNIDINTFMVEEGSTATSYEPYKGTDYLLSLGVKNLFNPALLSQEASYNTYNSTTGLWTTNGASAWFLSILYNVASNTTRDITKLIPLGIGTYTIKIYDFVNNTGHASPINYRLFNTSGEQLSTDNTANTTITITTTQKCYLDLCRTNSTGTLSFSKIQLEEGTIAHSYSPYGQEPIELCKMGNYNYKDIFVKPSGSNLFIKDYILAPIDTTQISANLQKGTYTLSLNGKPNFGNVIYIQLYKNGTLISQDGHITNTSSAVSYSTQSNWYYFQNIPNANYLTFTLDDDYDIKVAMYNADGTKKVMLNKGTTALPYEPYNNNKWYKKASIGKVVLDGSENEQWALHSSSTGTLYRYWLSQTSFTDIFTNIISGGESVLLNKVLCNIAKQDLYSNIEYGEFGINTTTPTASWILFDFDNSEISDLTKFRNYLLTNNAKLYYPLETPTYTLLNDTLQTQLDNIWNMKTNKNVTNISITADDLKPYLDIVYRKDLETLLGG